MFLRNNAFIRKPGFMATTTHIEKMRFSAWTHTFAGAKAALNTLILSPIKAEVPTSLALLYHKMVVD